MCLMLGVVILHSSAHSVVRCVWLGYMMHFCVTGFVFLSGYFGIKFSAKKLLKLYGVAVCSVLLASTTELIGGEVTTAREWLLSMKEHFMSCWFLHTYAALMFVSPLINSALASKGWEWPLLFLTFGWSYLTSFSFSLSIIPSVSGFGSHTLLTFVGIYAAARLFVKNNVETMLNVRTAIVGAVVLFAFGSIGLSKYNSPFSFALSVCCLIIFKQLFVLSGSISSIILKLSPSVFSIYVLHNSGYNEFLTSRLGALMINRGFAAWISCIVSAIITYGVCLLVDSARRSAFRLWR